VLEKIYNFRNFSKNKVIMKNGPRFCGRPGNLLVVMLCTISGDFKPQQKSASAINI
jgi:hypothetical protein